MEPSPSLFTKFDNWAWKDQQDIDNPLHLGCDVKKKSLLTVRVLSLIYGLIFLTIDFIHRRGKIWGTFIWMTSWGYLSVTTYFALSLIHGYIHKGKAIPSATKLGKLTYIFFEIGYSIQLAVIVVFWGVVFPYVMTHSTIVEDASVWDAIEQICLHGGFFILINIENYCNMIKPLGNHQIFVAGTILAYSTVNVTYTLSVGPIYPMITYKDVWSYLVGFGFLGFTMLGLRLCQWYWTKKVKRYECGSTLTSPLTPGDRDSEDQRPPAEAIEDQEASRY